MLNFLINGIDYFQSVLTSVKGKKVDVNEELAQEQNKAASGAAPVPAASVAAPVPAASVVAPAASVVAPAASVVAPAASVVAPAEEIERLMGELIRRFNGVDCVIEEILITDRIVKSIALIQQHIPTLESHNVLEVALDIMMSAVCGTDRRVNKLAMVDTVKRYVTVLDIPEIYGVAEKTTVH